MRHMHNTPNTRFEFATVSLKWLFILLSSFLALLFLIPQVNASYATSGSGKYRGELYWLDWSGFTVSEGATKTFTLPGDITITATFSKHPDNSAFPVLSPYRSGNYSGDKLDNAYTMPAGEQVGLSGVNGALSKYRLTF